MLMPKCILLLIHAVIVLGQDVAEKPIDNNNVDVNLTVTNTSELVTGSPILVPTLKPSPETPKTTTISTTKTPPITTPSTTVVPTVSSTTLVPTTTAPKPEQWVVSQNGTVCIIAKMDIKLNLKFDVHSKDISVKVPKDARVNGSCGLGEQSMVLTWGKNNLTFLFKANETLDKYHLDTVAVFINTGNDTVQQTDGNITMFETALNHSYSCSYSDPLKFTKNNETIEFTFSNIELAAFRKDNSTSFLNVSACPPDTPDIVPIVVGCALTVLVIVVLIAYLYGRRRTQARGYLSM
uniref:Lysosome-associated membrane glycoprotein 5 n=1 Tax=Panstrongylus lignarius TaxID=156445 RepID=A0A224XPI8_9HEMI